MSGAAHDDAELARALTPYLASDRPSAGGVLLAVSGGPDSTALMHAAARFRDAASIAVATVDHGLRPEASDEAESVAESARRLGLSHAVLRWATPVRAGIQAAARAARYRLLADHAVAIGADLILTGHTRDDQAETVLMRLLAGSGPLGLAGMRRVRPLGQGLRLARPFLDLPKAALTAYCERHDLPYRRDPSNCDPRFARARLRRLMPGLEEEGLSAGRLCRLAERLARDDAALDRAARDLFERARRPSETGLALDGEALLAAPAAIVLRVIGEGLERLQASPDRAVPRRLERLERLVLDALLPALAAGAPLRRTLRGVAIEAACSGIVRLTPAPARRSGRDLLGKGEGAAYIGRKCPD